MSNGNVLERLWKLEAMVNKLVLDGKRDPERVCDVLQEIVQESRAAAPVVQAEERPTQSVERREPTVETSAPPEPSVEVFFWRIGALNLASNAIRKLWCCRVRLIGQLVQLTAEQLQSRDVLRVAEVENVQAALAAHGLQLGMALSLDLRRAIWTMSRGARLEAMRITQILSASSEDKEELRCEICPDCGERTFRLPTGSPQGCFEGCSCLPFFHPPGKYSSWGREGYDRHQGLSSQGQSDRRYHGFTWDN